MAEETIHLAKCLLYKPGDLNLDPHYPHKTWVWWLCTYITLVLEASEDRILRAFWACQCVSFRDRISKTKVRAIEDDTQILSTSGRYTHAYTYAHTYITDNYKKKFLLCTIFFIVSNLWMRKYYKSVSH